MPTDAEFTTLELFVKVMKPLVDISYRCRKMGDHFSCASTLA